MSHGEECMMEMDRGGSCVCPETVAALRAELGALKEENARYRKEMERASGELRHAWRGMKRIVGLSENWKGFDSNLIDRAIVILECAAISTEEGAGK